MTNFKKHKPAPKKTTHPKKMTVTDTGNKSPYSKQNLKKTFDEFGENDAFYSSLKNKSHGNDTQNRNL